MSIASQISRLQSAKASLKTAIENKGVTVPSSALIDTYDDYVAEISGGGGGDTDTLKGIIDKSLSSITIPNGTTKIGEYAFYNCKSLTSVTIPNSVTSIGSNAFAQCTGLTSVTIGNNVTSIGSNAFTFCSGLTSINIPNSVTSIGNDAFTNCFGLTSVTIPNGVTSISEKTFLHCWGLTNITIPNSVTSIGTSAFNGCTGLTSVTIGSGVTSIGSNAFDQCSGLTSITIPSGVTSIGNYALSNCSSLTSITISDSVTSIGSGTFSNCSGLTSVTIPSGVTSIKDSVFEKCNHLTTITIPNGVTSIGQSAFNKCTSLQSITIPSGVTIIKNYAFQDCSSLTSITSCNVNPPVLTDKRALTKTNDCPIYVPAESVDDYKAAPNWNQYASRIQAIPSPSSQQWISVSADNNIPSGTVYDLRISSATTIGEGDSIMIEDNETFISIGNLCEAECTEYDEETEECMNAECTGHYTLGWGITDLGSGMTDPINPLTFGPDGYWYYNFATGRSGFESDGEAYFAPFDIQVLMDV